MGTPTNSFEGKVLRILTDDERYQIEIASIESGRSVSIEIQQFIAQTDRYKRLASDLQQVRAAYLKASQNNDETASDLEANLKDLRERERSFKFELLSYAKQIIQIDDGSSARITKARKLLFEGKLDESDALFDADELETRNNLLSQLIEVENKLTEIYEKFDINSKEFRIKARLTALEIKKGRQSGTFSPYYRAEGYFKSAQRSALKARTLPESYIECNIDFGTFQFSNHFYEKAQHVLEEALNKITDHSSVQVQSFRPKILDTLGDIYSQYFFYDKAVSAFQNAIYFTEQLSESTAQKIATLLSKKGLALCKARKYQLAEHAFSKGLDLLIVASKNSSVQYDHQVAAIYLNYASLKLETESLSEAMDYLLSAKNIYDQLITSTATFFKKEYAELLKFLGVLAIKQGELSAAKDVLLESVELVRGLVKVNYRYFEPQLAESLLPLAECYELIQDYDNASRAYHEAFQIHHNFRTVSAQGFYLRKAETAFKLGRFLVKHKRSDRSIRRYLATSNALFEDYSWVDPDNSLRKIAAINHLLGDYNGGESIRGKLRYMDAVQLYLKLFSKEPKSIYIEKLSELNQKLGEATGEDQYFVEANKYAAKLESYKNPTTLTESAVKHINSARLFKQEGKLEQAKRDYAQARYILEILDQSNPGAYKAHIASIYTNLGNIYSGGEQNYEKAMSHYVKALQLFENHLSNKPQDIEAQIEMEITRNSLGEAYRMIDEFALAQQAYFRAIQFFRELALKNEVEHSHFVSMVAGNLALLYCEYGPDKERSLLYVHEAILYVAPTQGTSKTAQNYFMTALQVLRMWDIEYKDFLRNRVYNIKSPTRFRNNYDYSQHVHNVAEKKAENTEQQIDQDEAAGISSKESYTCGNCGKHQQLQDLAFDTFTSMVTCDRCNQTVPESIADKVREIYYR